jgi:hypothetical protein
MISYLVWFPLITAWPGVLVPRCPAQVSSELTSAHTHSLMARGRRRGEHSTHTHTAEAPALAKALPLVVATELRITLPVLHYKYRGVGSVCV